MNVYESNDFFELIRSFRSTKIIPRNEAISPVMIDAVQFMKDFRKFISRNLSRGAEVLHFAGIDF